MRKLISISIAFLVLIGTIGFSFNLHVCSGKLVSFAFFNKPDKCCDESCKSCKDITSFYKISEKFVKHAVEFQKPHFTILELGYNEIAFSQLNKGISTTCTIVYPPPLPNIKTFILISILRI